MGRVLYVIYACIVIAVYTAVVYSEPAGGRIGGTGYRGGGYVGGGGGGGHK